MAISVKSSFYAAQHEAQPSGASRDAALGNADIELGELRLAVLAWLLDSSDEPALAAKSALERSAELPLALIAILQEIANAEPVLLQRRVRRRRSIN